MDNGIHNQGLALDIEEAILFLPAVEAGDDPVRVRQLRPVIAVLDWGRQRWKWQRLVARE